MNPFLIFGIVAILFAALSRKKPGEGTPENTPGPGEVGGRVAPPDADLARVLRDAFNRVVLDFGVDIARNVERIYRLETDNFKSLQFLRTNTPGMHAFKAAFPFGWSLESDGLVPSDFNPTITMDENDGGTYQWVVFKDLGQAIHYVGYFMKKWNNNPGRWKSTDPVLQTPYNNAVAKYPTPIVNSITTGF